MIKKRVDKRKDLDLNEVRSIIKDSLVMSLEKLTLTLSDHRYHQGIIATLKDLDKILQTP